jgi:hypothetical protein
VYQWCELKSRRGKNKKLSAHRSTCNSNTVWLNFQTTYSYFCYIYSYFCYIYSYFCYIYSYFCDIYSYFCYIYGYFCYILTSFLILCYILDVYLLFLFVCTESLTLVSDPSSRRFIRWLLFQTYISENIRLKIKLNSVRIRF